MSRTINASGEFVYKCEFCGKTMTDNGDDSAKHAGWKFYVQCDERKWCCCDKCLENAKRGVITLTFRQLIFDAQTRCEISKETVDSYFGAMADGAEFPPIEVVRAEDTEERYYIIDGCHRAKAIGLCAGPDTTIRAVNVGRGSSTLEQAIWLASAANQRHGIPRTKEDIKNAVRCVLMASPDRTDKEIAEHIGGPGICSEYIVRVVREELANNGKIPQKLRPAEKVEAALSDPNNADKSNRELAKNLDVDEKTVRKVRNSCESKKIRTEKTEDWTADYPQMPDDKKSCAECGEKNVIVKQVNAIVVHGRNSDFVARFCDENCAQRYADKMGMIFDPEKLLFTLPEHETPAEASADGQEDFDPQERPSIAKVTKETRRVVPDVEKPSEPVVITRKEEFREQWRNRREFLIGEKEPLNDLLDKIVIALENRPGLLLALRDMINDQLAQ